jgi:hypothetical protein
MESNFSLKKKILKMTPPRFEPFNEKIKKKKKPLGGFEPLFEKSN